MQPSLSKKASWALVGIIGVAALAGCSRSPGEETSTTTITSAEPPGCALGIPGARTVVVDTPEGADLTITAPPAQIDELRYRVRDAAGLHGPGAHAGDGHQGAHLGAERHGLRLTALPALAATADDATGGARLRLVAKRPLDVVPLQKQVRARVAIVNQGACD